MVTGFRVTIAEEGVRALGKGWAPTAIGYSLQAVITSYSIHYTKLYEVQGSSEGFYEPSGKHKWRVRGTLRTSTGAMFRSDGIISLDGRTYKGSLTAWS